jgi:hypothetical protein
MQSNLLSRLIAPARLASLSPAGILLIRCARIIVIAQRRDQNPLAPLSDRLGCAGRAQRMLHLISIVGFLWPERFTLSPPCCAMLSHDEALLGALAGTAVAHDRPGFDHASHELLSEDTREQLWRELRACFA